MPIETGSTADVPTPRTRMAPKRLLQAASFPVLLAVLLILLAYVRTHSLVLDPDTWWHIKVGDQILSSGHWPRSDAFSFTAAGTRWIAYEWLGEVLMAASARLAGLQGLTLLLILITSILALLLYHYAYLRCRNSKAAFVATLTLLPLAATCFTLRPQLIGYSFLLVTLIILERYRDAYTRLVWLLPAVFLVWVNTHGSFVLGLLVVGVFWLSGLKGFSKGGLVAERWKRRQRIQLLVVLLCCVLVLPLTPYGSHPAAYPIEMALYQPVNLSQIDEWRPLGLDSPLGKVVTAVLFVLLLSQIILRPVHRVPDVVLLLFSTYSTFVHTRFVVFFVLIATPCLALLLARWIPPYEPAKDKPLLNLIAMVLLCLAFVYSFPTSKKLDDRVATEYPKAAVAYLRNHPPAGNVFNDYFFGGYLMWSMSRDHRVFIDGRADVYEYSGVLEDYLEMVSLRQTLPFLLRRYDIRACLLQPQNHMRTALSQMPHWRIEYADPVSVLYVCDSCGTQAPGANSVVSELWEQSGHPLMRAK